MIWTAERDRRPSYSYSQAVARGASRAARAVRVGPAARAVASALLC